MPLCIRLLIVLSEREVEALRDNLNEGAGFCILSFEMYWYALCKGLRRIMKFRPHVS